MFDSTENQDVDALLGCVGQWKSSHSRSLFACHSLDLFGLSFGAVAHALGGKLGPRGRGTRPQLGGRAPDGGQEGNEPLHQSKLPVRLAWLLGAWVVHWKRPGLPRTLGTLLACALLGVSCLPS